MRDAVQTARGALVGDLTDIMMTTREEERVMASIARLDAQLNSTAAHRYSKGNTACLLHRQVAHMQQARVLTQLRPRSLLRQRLHSGTSRSVLHQSAPHAGRSCRQDVPQFILAMPEAK